MTGDWSGGRQRLILRVWSRGLEKVSLLSERSEKQTNIPVCWVFGFVYALFRNQGLSNLPRSGFNLGFNSVCCARWRGYTLNIFSMETKIFR